MKSPARKSEKPAGEGASARFEFAVTGMSCAGCAANIEGALRKVEGVREANVNLALARATVLYDLNAGLMASYPFEGNANDTSGRP